MQMEHLPRDMMSVITSYLSRVELVMLKRVSKSLNKLIGKVRLNYLDACYEASRDGSIKTLEWLQENGAEWDTVVRRRCNILGVKSLGIPKTPTGVIHIAACLHVQLDVLKWMYKNYRHYDCIECAQAAILSGSTEVMEHLYLQDYYLPSTLATTAARHGKLDVYKWLNFHGSELVEHDCILAARGGHLELLAWIRRQLHHSDRMDNSICSIAASNGRLEVLKYMKKQGVPIRRLVLAVTKCSVANRGNQIAILEWLKKQGDKNTTTKALESAAKHGNLEVVKWLRNEGCVYNDTVMRAAIKGGNLEVVKWLMNDGCPMIDDPVSCAVEYGSLNILEWLLETGYVLSDNVWSVAMRGRSIPMLKWLATNRCLTEEVCVYAVRTGRLNVVKLMWRLKCPWSRDAYQIALDEGYNNIFNWMVSAKCTWYEEHI